MYSLLLQFYWLLAPALVFAQSSEQLQQVIEKSKHLVSSLFATLQTIPTIWGFRTKDYWSYTKPFPHPKHKKMQSGQETNVIL